LLAPLCWYKCHLSFNGIVLYMGIISLCTWTTSSGWPSQRRQPMLPNSSLLPSSTA
jgi:hypothetical protein